MSFSTKINKPILQSSNSKLSPLPSHKNPTPLTLSSFESRHNLLFSPSPKHPYSSSITPTVKNSFKDFAYTKDFIWQQLQQTLGQATTRKLNNSFHKSKDFIERKQKIKKNVKEHKYESSDKLKKLKSIIEFDENHDFLTGDDLVNDEGSCFLALNRRKFGESKNSDPRFRSKKKTFTISKKFSRNPSLPEVQPAKSPEPKFNTHRKSMDTPISEPVVTYIKKEMKKMWPPDTELIHTKKQKILRVKLEKLSEIMEENPYSKKPSKKRQLGEKQKLDSKIEEHYKKLNKKIRPIQ